MGCLLLIHKFTVNNLTDMECGFFFFFFFFLKSVFKENLGKKIFPNILGALKIGPQCFKRTGNENMY